MSIHCFLWYLFLLLVHRESKNELLHLAWPWLKRGNMQLISMHSYLHYKLSPFVLPFCMAPPPSAVRGRRKGNRFLDAIHWKCFLRRRWSYWWTQWPKVRKRTCPRFIKEFLDPMCQTHLFLLLLACKSVEYTRSKLDISASFEPIVQAFARNRIYMNMSRRWNILCFCLNWVWIYMNTQCHPQCAAIMKKMWIIVCNTK